MKFSLQYPADQRVDNDDNDVMMCSHAGGSQPVRHVSYTEYSVQEGISTQDIKCDRTEVSTL